MKQGKKSAMIAKLSALSAAIAVATITPANADDSLKKTLTSGKAGLELRYRFETVEQDDTKKDATASTLRMRLNYTTDDYKGFSAFIEFDDITAFGNIEYNNATGRPTAKTDYSVVADPEGTEVNQANITYSGITDTTVKLGRQRVIFDNARFIGNVGWRQNEQTYDALAVINTSLTDTTIVYGYVSNVNRIFGEGALNRDNTGKVTGDKGDIDTKTHLLNISYSGLDAGKLTFYGYFLDLIDAPTTSNATMGARFNGGTQISDGFKLFYTAEYATQSDYKDGASTIDADYNLIELGAKFSGITTKLGYEVLGKGTSAFSTPLATAHAFNGWADKFLGTPTDGLVDTYISVSAKVAGVKLLGVYHDYSADQGGASYGDEINLLAAKKFCKNYSGLIKYASYSKDTYATDTNKLWLMGQAKF